MKTSQVMNILRHTVNLMFASETHTALVNAEFITGFEVHWWWAFRFPFFNSGPYCLLSAFLLSIACRYPSSSNTKYLNTQLLVIRCIKTWMDLFLKGSAWKALKLRLQTPAIQRDDHLVNYGEQIIEQCRSWSYLPTSGLMSFLFLSLTCCWILYYTKTVYLRFLQPSLKNSVFLQM